MEKKIAFQSETYEIEGLFSKNEGERGVVVTHPHPLYGGDMHNYVVESIVRAYTAKGYVSILLFILPRLGKLKKMAFSVRAVLRKSPGDA